jgi:predicted site-specific integrase-resolvase
MLTAQQIGAILGVSSDTVHMWRRRGVIAAERSRRVRLKAIRQGGRYRFKSADLCTFLCETGYDPLPEPLLQLARTPGSF